MSAVSPLEVTLNEINVVEQTWTRQGYVEFPQRRDVIRYARIGAVIESLSRSVEGPIADQLKNAITLAETL